MRNKLSQRQIEVAVDWWANTLRGEKSFQIGASQAERDADPAIERAEVAATMASMCKTYTDDVIDRFKERLTENIHKSNPIDIYHLGLRVDYHPCVELFEALKMAGVPMKSDVDSMVVLPSKTYMSFKDGGVQVGGSGRKMQKLL